MLKFNFLKINSKGEMELNLNTYHVKVQLKMLKYRLMARNNLNTYHVKVQLSIFQREILS